MTALALCRDTLSNVTRQKWLSAFKVTGPHRPAGRSSVGIPDKLDKLLSYRQRVGPLYEDKRQWRAAYRLVHSFSRNGARDLGSELSLGPMFDALHAPVADVLRFLPSAFAVYGFRREAGDGPERTLLFRSEHSCPIEQLPEPYGKWLQQECSDPKWERPFSFDVSINVTLGAQRPDECRLDLNSSTFLPPVYDHLCESLGRFTGQSLKPLGVPVHVGDPRCAWMFQ